MLDRIFRRHLQSGLCRTVYETILVPRFVRPGTKDVDADMREGESVPFGLQPASARQATAVLGETSSTRPARRRRRNIGAAGHERTAFGLRQIKGVQCSV